MDPVSELNKIFDDIAKLPDDQQFVAWNEVMEWLQSSMSEVAMWRRLALHRYRRTHGLTRRQLADQFHLTFTTVSRLMDEVNKDEPDLDVGS
jgi:DNA-binding XRE family transcriptional regulator